MSELQRAPIIDLAKRNFRRSFPLSVDYKLLKSTALSGHSPKEELLLFAHQLVIDKNPVEAVVSLLNPRYGGTAFCVSPAGGLITCYHNLSLNDDGPIEDLWIHRRVVSPSYDFAGSKREKVEFVPCELPLLDDDLAKDPVDGLEPMRVSLKHQDIAFLRSLPGVSFLIPCAMDLLVGEAVVCMGYPGKVTSDQIEDAYKEINPDLAPDREEYNELFKVGYLSLSPGPIIACNSSALACEVATVPRFSGSPVCLLENPRMFVGIHYRARYGKNYALSVSVKDAGFYYLYSALVVPELRNAVLCQEDIDAINDYLRIGTTPLLTSRTPV